MIQNENFQFIETVRDLLLSVLSPLRRALSPSPCPSAVHCLSSRPLYINHHLESSAVVVRALKQTRCDTRSATSRPRRHFARVPLVLGRWLGAVCGERERNGGHSEVRRKGSLVSGEVQCVPMRVDAVRADVERECTRGGVQAERSGES